MYKIIFIWYLLIFTLTLICAEDQQTVYINRKVVIMPFYNAANDEFDYISEELNKSIINKLNKIGTYDVIENKDVSLILKKNQIENNSFIWEDDAYRISELVNTDVVLFGLYKVSDNELTIFFNALDAQIGKSSFKYNKTDNINNSISNLINQSVSEFTDILLTKLPPFEKNISVTTDIAFLGIAADETLNNEKAEFKEALLSYLKEKKDIKLLPEENVLSALRDLQVRDTENLSNEQIAAMGEKYNVDIIITGKMTRNGFTNNFEISGYSTKSFDKIISKTVDFKRLNLSKSAHFIGFYITNYDKMDEDE